MLVKIRAARTPAITHPNRFMPMIRDSAPNSFNASPQAISPSYFHFPLFRYAELLPEGLWLLQRDLAA